MIKSPFRFAASLIDPLFRLQSPIYRGGSFTSSICQRSIRSEENYPIGFLMLYFFFLFVFPRPVGIDLQTYAVILTGVAVIWYSLETMLLRKETFAQREAHIKPFIVVEIERNDFRVRNLGFGTALNVKILDVISSRIAPWVMQFPFRTSLNLSADFQMFCAAITNCLKKTHTEYRDELDSLLRPNYQSFTNVTFNP